ncbi:MAG TPA: hypothetical protein VI854_06465, partial [Acidimicrobiia bacterium]|nr:hypothetical protein [Acidimicrobiia bacterium]
RRGRDKLTLMLHPAISAFGAWIEQLVAESTGKEGTGIVPVDGEPPRPDADYGPDRFFVGIGSDASVDGHPGMSFPLDDPYELGGEVFRWEVATALAGHLLGVNPFDQPDVQAAKERTERVLTQGLPDLACEALGPMVSAVGPCDYLVVQAFVDPWGPLAGDLRRATTTLGQRLGVAATFGLGPRYLHSTGQLHKGGPPPPWRRPAPHPDCPPRPPGTRQPWPAPGAGVRRPRPPRAPPAPVRNARAPNTFHRCQAGSRTRLGSRVPGPATPAPSPGP